MPKARSKPRELKSCFVLTFKLAANKWQEDVLNKRLDIGRRIYNTCLNELYKRYRTMTQSKEYQRAMKMPVKTEQDRTKRNALLREFNTKYNLTEYSMHDFVRPMQHHFVKNIRASVLHCL